MNTIKNKIKRTEVFQKLKAEKAQEKLKRRQAIKKEEAKDPSLREERLEKNAPKTLENMREADVTIVGDDEEVSNQISRIHMNEDLIDELHLIRSLRKKRRTSLPSTLLMERPPKF